MAGDEDEQELGTEVAALLWIALGPAIWTAHFLGVYIIGAVLCAKTPAVALGTTRIVTVLLTLAALTMLLVLLRLAWRRWDVVRHGDILHEGDTIEDRHRFGGHAAFLLTGLAIIGVLMMALPPFFIDTCR
jgi:hypothetical protein